MAEEVWAVIEGFERYEVSNLGRVRAIATGHLLRIRPSSYNGYIMVGMRADGGQRTMRVHALVARAFVPNPDGKQQVDHLDGDRTNNAAANLEWVTARENRQRAVARGSSGAATNPNFRFKLTPADVNLIRTSAESARVLADRFGVDNTTISRVRRGVSWKHSHLPTAYKAHVDLREECAKIAEGYARGCVTNELCARIASDIRALGVIVSKQAAADGDK